VLLLVMMLPGGLARLMYGARDWIVQRLTGIDVRPHVEPVSVTSFDLELTGAKK
jgi:hypothetical protein